MTDPLPPFRLLIAESETQAERDTRRASVHRSMGETWAALLEVLAPGSAITRIMPADDDAEVLSAEAIAGYDAVIVTGAPLHVYDDTPETRRQLAFMRAVFASGTPSFGSCAGLQLAVAAAGGQVRAMQGKEAGLARRIVRTAEGADHPMLAGRGLVWDAPAVHNDEVEALPEGATLLATSAATRVQAAEIRHDAGVFWGVQYHPELPLEELAAALRRQAGDIVDHGLALTTGAVEEQAALFDALARRPDRLDLQWRLGVDDEIVKPDQRQREITNFLRHLVLPRLAARQDTRVAEPA